MKGEGWTGDGMGSMRTEEGQLQSSQTQPSSFSNPYRLLLITRSQVIPGSWTEPGHPAGVGARVLQYLSRGSRDWRPVSCTHESEAPPPTFSLPWTRNGGIQTRGCSFWANLGHHRHPVYLTAKRPPPPLPRQHTQQSFRSLVVLPNPRGFPKPGLSARGVREGSLSGRSSAIENFGCTRLVNACEWGAPWSIRLNAPHQKHHRLEGDSAQMRMPRQGAGDWGNRGDQGCGSRWGLPRHPGSRQERILLPLPPPGAGTCRPRVCSKGDPPPAAHRSYLNQAAAPRSGGSVAR